MIDSPSAETSDGELRLWFEASRYRSAPVDRITRLRVGTLPGDHQHTLGHVRGAREEFAELLREHDGLVADWMGLRARGLTSQERSMSR